MEEKRKYNRYTLECTGLAVTPTDLQQVYIHDVSQNGIQFSFHHDTTVHEGYKLRLYFFEPESRVLCTVDATVARVFKDGSYYAVGATFSEDLSTIKQVIALLESQQGGA